VRWLTVARLGAGGSGFEPRYKKRVGSVHETPAGALIVVNLLPLAGVLWWGRI